ncbi:MAG: DUF1287 domain-containing protein [Neomegalonema sp.]|nr:DUF1287 domain-containing protein [Neomegalonema sp.]
MVAMRGLSWAVAAWLICGAFSPALAEPSKPGFGLRLAVAAADRIGKGVIYDGSYQRIGYPMGDVSPTRGVCTDLVVRAYRALGVDLQQLVHQDMRRNFSAYPKNWGLRRPDANIDHRRVPNLETFFKRKGAARPISRKPGDYLPGDVVSYRLPSGRPHIAIVTSRLGRSGAPMIAHNIGPAPSVEDALFAYRIVGHFRFHPKAAHK